MTTLSAIRIGIQSAVIAYMSSSPQNSSQSVSVSYINIRSIILSQVPLFQVGSLVKVVRVRPSVSSSFSRQVAYTSSIAYCPPYNIQYALKSPRTITSPSAISIVCQSSPYIAIWGLLSFRLQTLIILIQPRLVASYSLSILGLIFQQLYACILMRQLTRKYIQVARFSLYRR